MGGKIEIKSELNWGTSVKFTIKPLEMMYWRVEETQRDMVCDEFGEHDKEEFMDWLQLDWLWSSFHSSQIRSFIKESIKVMIVDDNYFNVEVLQQLISSIPNEFEVHSSFNGEEAFE